MTIRAASVEINKVTSMIYEPLARHPSWGGALYSDIAERHGARHGPCVTARKQVVARLVSQDPEKH
jgi:hypothetical protein